MNIHYIEFLYGWNSYEYDILTEAENDFNEEVTNKIDKMNLIFKFLVAVYYLKL